MNCIKILKLLVIVVLTSFAHLSTYSQVNSQCANATPFCTGVPMSLPAAVNAPPAQPGPCYGCLGSEPNPAWFFLQMTSGGPVSISMSANSDIDFICWGPFPSLAGVCSQLCGNIQSCSYSASNTETCTIANAVAGAFYVLLITNFSNQNQQINFNQNNTANPNAGATNCGVICGITLTNSGKICSGQSNTLTATTGTSVVSYTLNGPSGLIAGGPLTSANHTLTSVVPNIASTSAFTLMATTSAGSCQAVSTVSVLQYPTFSITPSNPAICQGGQLTAGVSFTGTNTQAPYTYNWSANIVSGTFATASPGTGIFSPGNQQTMIHPSNIVGNTATVLYTAIVSPSALSCPTTHTMLLTINNPLTPTLNIPPTICNTSTVMLTAAPGGGTWSANPAVFSNGLFTAASATAFGTNTVMYTVGVGLCNVSNTGTISVSKFNTPALTNTVGLLCETQQPFDLMTIVQNTLGGTWSGGPYVSNNQFIPSGLASGSYNITYSTVSTPIASVCPASTTIPVQVFNPPTPVLSTPIASLCNNAGTLQLVATPTIGGIWSNNSAVAALTGVFTPSVITSGGIQMVHYTSGIGTCTASSSMTLEVSQFRTAALTGLVPDLCVSNNPFNLMSIVSLATGTWSGGNVNSTTNTFDPSSPPPPQQNNNYVLTYNNSSFPHAGLCDDSRTITVSVLNPPTPFITQAGPFCSINNTVQLTVSPSTGSWVPSSYLTSTGVFSPSLSPIGNNVVQYVIGTHTCNVSKTASISVEGFVSAGITGSIADQCTTNPPLNLLPFTLNTLGTWSGPGVLGASFNPSVSGTGTVTLTYNTASSPSGLCPDQSTVAVSVYSLALPIFSNVKAMCNSAAPIKLNVSPVGGIFGGANTNAVDNQGVFQPASARIGDNIVNYSITAGPCIARASTTITIEQFVSADLISSAGPFCKNDPRKARNLDEIALNPGGEWGGPGVVGNLFTFANANVGNNNVISYMTHSMPTATLCPDTSNVRIQVYEAPAVSAVSNKYQGCAPVEVMLNSPEGIAGGVGTWDFGDGSEPEQNTGIKHTFTTPGSYTVVYTYSLMLGSDFACVSQAVIPMPIRIFETPQPEFTYAPDEIKISEPTVQFNNVSASVEKNRYQWTISGNELNQSLLEVQPSVTFPHVGDYKVTLSATNLSGCKNEVTKIIKVGTDFNIYIPTTFSPNDDGLNDFFFPVFSEYGLDDKTFEMQIFDRWGNLLYQTKDKTQKWDGKKSGQSVKQDVYVYKIKYKDVSGNVYNKTGYISVIR